MINFKHYLFKNYRNIFEILNSNYYLCIFFVRFKVKNLNSIPVQMNTQNYLKLVFIIFFIILIFFVCLLCIM